MSNSLRHIPYSNPQNFTISVCHSDRIEESPDFFSVAACGRGALHRTLTPDIKPCVPEPYNRTMPFESVRKLADADFPTRWGQFRILGFEGVVRSEERRVG